MKDKLSIAFATLAGVCFISGLVILKTKGDDIFGKARENLIYAR